MWICPLTISTASPRPLMVLGGVYVALIMRGVNVSLERRRCIPHDLFVYAPLSQSAAIPKCLSVSLRITSASSQCFLLAVPIRAIRSWLDSYLLISSSLREELADTGLYVHARILRHWLIPWPSSFRSLESIPSSRTTRAEIGDMSSCGVVG